MKWDIFICHASEDKETVVRQLVHALESKGLRIWYDEFTLTLGDSLRGSIDKGLIQSRFGIVVLSKAFFKKKWTQYELDGLLEREMTGRKVILPIWHEITHDEIMTYSPSLAGKLAVSTSDGWNRVIGSILAVVQSNPDTDYEDILDIKKLRSEYGSYKDILSGDDDES
jgi:hypothetical protein